MRQGQRVAVVVPAYNERRLIQRTLDGLPAWVDTVHLVDDASTDETNRVARLDGARLHRIRHRNNRGVGAAIVTGYYRALAADADVIAVMAADNQMDAEDLPRLIEPVLRGQADYVKGDRFAHPNARAMPAHRRVAGRLLARATRAATGLDIDDPQCGFTAIGRQAASLLPLDDLWPGYGYPNDLLALCAAYRLRVVEVPVRPVYADEHSGVRPWHALRVLWLLGKRWNEARRQ